MKTILNLIPLLCYFASSAQSVTNWTNYKFNLSLTNVKVYQISTDSNSTSFAITIAEGVKPHYHAFHTESLMVISGKAELVLNDSLQIISKGDFINIPPKTVHSVKVISESPLQVISVQSPEFKGKDRVLTE